MSWGDHLAHVGYLTVKQTTNRIVLRKVEADSFQTQLQQPRACLSSHIRSLSPKARRLDGKLLVPAGFHKDDVARFDRRRSGLKVCLRDRGVDWNARQIDDPPRGR